MAEITMKERFTQKAGPLPVWGWVVLIGVGYYIYTKRKAAAAPTDTTGVTDLSQDTGTGVGDLTPALITSEYDLANAMGILNSNVSQNTVTVGDLTKVVQKDVVADTPKPSKPRPNLNVGKYYRDKGNGAIWHVVGNIRWHITPTTWRSFGAKKPALIPIDKKWAGYKQYKYGGTQ